MAEDNAVIMSATDSSVAQFIQEMPSLEDTGEDILAEASSDASSHVRGISRCVDETEARS